MSSVGTTSAYQRGEDHFERGEFHLARTAYAEVVEAAATMGDGSHVCVLAAVQRLAEIAVLAGEWDIAIERLEFVRSAFVRSANGYMADYIATRIAAVLNATGAGRQAFVVLGQLLGRPADPWVDNSDDLAAWEARWTWPRATPADRGAFFSGYYLEAAQVEAYRGQFERATVLLRRGLECARLTEDARAATRLCLTLASCYLQWGDLPSASISLDLVAPESGERSSVGDVVFRLEVSGRLAWVNGNLGAAKASFERALDVCAAVNADAAWQTAALNLVQVLVLLNQGTEARRLCNDVQQRARLSGNRAIEMRAAYLESFSDDRTRSLVGGVSLAPSISEMWLGSRREEPLVESGSRPTPFDIDESADYLTLFEERALGFFWLLSRGSLDGAAAYLGELESIFVDAQPPTDSLLIHVRLHVLACMLAYYQARYADAITGLRPACATLRQLGLKPELWQALRFLEWALIRSGSGSEAHTVGDESARVLSALTDSLAGADLVLFLLNKWTAAELYMAGEVEALVALKHDLERSGWWAALVRPWRRLALSRRLIRLLDYADRYKAAIFEQPSDDEVPTPSTSAQTVSIARLLRHPRASATIAWIVLPDLTLVARARWLSLDFGVSGVSKLQIRSWVKQWHEAVRDEEPSKGAAAIRQLAMVLQIDEIMHALPRRIRELVCVPDDVLHGVPFAALRYIAATDGTEHYVGETHAVSVAFHWWRERVNRRAPSMAVVVAVPYGAGGYDPLTHATEEVSAVARQLRQRGFDVKTPASPAEITTVLPEASYFHIACHGRFEANRPDRSGLVLISPTRTIEMLTVRDIAGLDLRNMEQAVLSGCWAADSYILPGRWIISVPSALCRRGARVVVASLWPVDDRVAPQFFARLYDEAQGLPTERLFRVRRALLSGSLDGVDGVSIDQLKDPFFWAGVQVYTGA